MSYDALMIPVFNITMKHLLYLNLALMLALSVTSCSTRFNQVWKKSAASIETTSPHDVSGAWQGTWKSYATGHTGTLKAVVTKPNTKEGIYTFYYLATWKHILSATFQSEHMVKPQGANFLLTGQHDLGALFGGIYRYDGTATSAKLKCNYRCDLDHGIFEMQRP